jgi:hypothetical protein
MAGASFFMAASCGFILFVSLKKSPTGDRLRQWGFIMHIFSASDRFGISFQR